ncbi:MAG TPA: glycosyltransferase family 4 protein [Gemmatimonadales bacterium]|nr:glycosyltransferase family 4 protein [Gemmatimonadales bacterium]
MRILYFYSWQHFTTGSPKMLATTVELVDRTRHQPVFLATGEGPLVTELAERGAEIVRRPVSEVAAGRPLRASGNVMGAARWLKRQRIDLLHVNEFGWNQDIVLGAWLARVPVVLHVHTKLRIHPRNLNRLAAWRVLFVSEAHRRETAGLELIDGKARVLHNAIDVERYARGRNIRAELGLAPSDTVITTVCQISERKAVDVFLDVAAALLRRTPSLTFLIVGPVGRGEQAYADRQTARAADPAFGGRVRFLGPRQDIPDILKSSDIFFLPSRHETYGLVVAEAMAASLPVVASNAGGIPEIVSSATIGSLAQVDDREGFVTALDLLVDSPERRRIIGCAARKSLDGRFDRATYARALDALYAEA